MSADEKGGRRARRAPRVGSTGARFPRLDDAGDEPVDVAPEASAPEVVLPAEEDQDADAHVGRTGARFNSRSRRARRDAERAAAEDAAVPVPAAPAPIPAVEPEPDDAPTVRLPSVQLAVEETRTRVRPYVRTRGRTRSRNTLAVETLVSIPIPRPSIEDPEHAAIDQVCDGPRSVAEVAARLEIPLGVARVLIDDMAAEGLLTVHATASHGGAPPMDIMRRVLDGLHRL